MPMLLKVPPPHLPMLAIIKNNKSGYALLEILLAFAVATIIITGMVSLGVSTVRAVTVNKAYSEAGKIAQREVDRLKLLRDTYPATATRTSWENFYDEVISQCGTNCYVVTGATFTKAPGTYTVGTAPSTVSYYFKFTSASVTSPAKYEVITTWSVGNPPEKTYKIEGVFTNWKEI